MDDLDFFSDEVGSFLNDRFKSLDDLSKVPSLIHAINKNNVDHHARLAVLQAEAPAKIQVATQAAETSKSRLETYSIEVQQLQSGIKALAAECEPVVSDMKPLLQQLKTLQLVSNYTKVISHVEATYAEALKVLQSLLTSDDSRSKFESATLVQVVERLIPACDKLRNITNSLANLKAPHLHRHTELRLQELKDMSKSHLKKAYEKAYAAIGWPNSLQDEMLSVNSSATIQFKNVFIALLSFQRATQLSTLSFNSFPPPSLLPIEWLLERVVMSFKFNFRSKQATNRLDKPEWQFAYVQTMLKDHTKFLDYLTDVIASQTLGQYDANVEFARGLIVEVNDKLLADLAVITTKLNDDSLFWSTLNETIDFEKVLGALVDYPKEYLRPISVFSENRMYFDKWIRLEADFSKQHFREVMNSSSAWSRHFEDVPLNADEVRMPHCAFSLFGILSLVQERCQAIPTKKDQLEFLEKAQVQLLDDFVSDLHLFESEDFRYIKAPKEIMGYCMVYNCVRYCGATMKDWSDQLVRLPHPCPRAIFLEKTKRGEMGNENTSNSGSIFFESLVSNCKKLESHMVKRMASTITRNVLNSLQAYSKRKFIVVALDTSVGLDVSSELADGLVVLRDWLEAVNKSLRISAIPKVVQGIHTALESFFVDNIVMKQHFSMEGARQFETDLKATRSVLQSFASLECFPRSMACATILLASEEAAKGFVDEATRALSDPPKVPPDAIKHLIGPSSLSYEDISAISNRRVRTGV